MATQDSITFTYTGGWQTLVVPRGISQLGIRVEGAGSGGRRGGLVTGQLPINPGEVLWILVGQEGRPHAGSNGGKGGFPNGGPGGDGRNGKAGGDGGAGATIIRRGSQTGAYVMIAGGAGGTSGDNGEGGRGGADSGGDGEKGNAGNGSWFPASGGGPRRPGHGGSSGGGSAYGGTDGGDFPTTPGGRGGESSNGHGGGGGGGGWFSGGGGTASAAQNNPGGAPDRKFPGGGGGGGSNYVHPLIQGGANNQGGGGANGGVVTISWSATPDPNRPPASPTDVTVNGIPAVDETVTKAGARATIQARLEDSNVADDLRLVLVPSPQGAANPWRDITIVGGDRAHMQALDDTGRETGSVWATLEISPLSPNTLYEGMLYAVDEAGEWSARQEYEGGPYVQQGTKVSFWTNRSPNPPPLNLPRENSQIDAGLPITFTWDFDDPDGGSVSGGYAIRWRAARTPSSPPGPWVQYWEETGALSHAEPASSFKAGVLYEWQVRSRDPEGLWGDFAVPQSFYIIGDTTPPVPLAPINGVAQIVGDPTTFAWRFRDTNSGVSQISANLRYRVVGTKEWIPLIGDTTQPGSVQSWTLPPGTFLAGQQYEWQAQTRSSALLTSDWSESAFFWAVVTPGATIDLARLGSLTAKGSLGSGHNEACIYLRGGEVYRGRLSEVSYLRWDRRRDDIGEARVVVDNFPDSLLSLLAGIHTWSHELVIFRVANGVRERVWEGPITYIQDDYDRWVIEAGDCMRYLARRVMRQGYDDAYQVIGGTTVPGGIVGGYQTGLKTVVERAERLVLNALAYDDPNVLPYLTALKFPNDARQSRVMPDYSRMVWEDIDDMASNAGLDYTTVGRRIVLWDTHRAIGRLPELRNESFSAPPVITEYGMQLANHYGVSDGSGVYGVAERGIDEVTGDPLYGYGWVEMLATAYGVDAERVADASTLTAAQRAALEATYAEQADRNIAHRFPAPYEVRLPENVRLMPTVDIGINQLVPGTWMPVRARSRVREIAQWQKLDRVTCTQTADGEEITVIMAPAPNGGDDPDAAAVEP